MTFRYNTGNDELDADIAKLAALAMSEGMADGSGELPHHRDARDVGLIREMMTSAVRLGREDVERGDLKLVSAALKELRYAYSVFAPYRHRRKLSIFGSARTKPDNPEYQTALATGRAIAERDWMVITGAGPGIMQAGVEGAGIENSFGVGIQLPFEPSPPEIFEDGARLINFRYFFTRKVTFMRESDAFVALPGGFGTMDEAFELLTLLQTGKTVMTPLVLLESPGGNYWDGWLNFVQDELFEDGLISPEDLRLVKITDSVDEAVEEVCGFFRNYHSMRFVGGRLVLRLQELPTAELLTSLNDEFSHIVTKGRIEVVEESEAESDDVRAAGLPRIGFSFDKASYGRLRMLVDMVNGQTPAAPKLPEES